MYVHISEKMYVHILEWRLLQVMALMILDPYSVFSHIFTGYICERSKIALIWMVLIGCQIYGWECFASFFIQRNYTYLPSQGDIQSIQPTTHPLYYGATYIQDGIFLWILCFNRFTLHGKSSRSEDSLLYQCFYSYEN